MDRFTYTWRDFALALRLGLNPRRILLGSAVMVWTGAFALLFLLLYGLFSGRLAPESVSGSPFAWLPPRWIPAFAGFAALFWWWGFAWLSVALMRSAVIELCADRPPSLRGACAYSRAYGRYAFRAPFGLLVPALPLAFLLGLWGLTLFIPSAGPWIAALTSPVALLLGAVAAALLMLGAVTLPYTIAGVAAHGPDGYEALSRAMMYGAMAPLRASGLFGAKAVVTLVATVLAALIFAGAGWIVGGIYQAAAGIDALLDALHALQAFGPSTETREAVSMSAAGMAFGVLAAAVPFLGYILATAASGDVVAFLLLRHHCDGVAVTEFFDPVRAFTDKATLMEQDLAVKDVREEGCS